MFAAEVKSGSGEIAIHYVKSWFFIDVVSCLPFGYISLLADNDVGGSGVRLAKVLRLFRVARILKLLRLRRIIEQYQRYMYSHGEPKMGSFLPCAHMLMQHSRK